MHTFRKTLRQISTVVGILLLAIIIILCVFWLCFRIKIYITKPNTEELINYATWAYQKEFTLVREYTRTTYMDGEDPIQIRRSPAVELEDPNTGIRFEVYAAFPVYDWDIRDNYSHEVLLYCIKEQGLQIEEEDSSIWPCLLLENSRSEAEKLQRMTIQYNEIYSVDKSKSYHTWECFTIPNSMYLFTVEACFVSDRWLDQDSPFCFDTPIEKYEEFLKEVVG